MKSMKVTMMTVLSAVLFAPAAQAKVLLLCENGRDRLKVYGALYDTQFLYEASSGDQVPGYVSHGEVKPVPLADGSASRVFESDAIRIFHLFGEYMYSDKVKGVELLFPDATCVVR